MPELSNLLRQRLEAGETVSPAHPDADMLTAYVEQLLPSAERRSVTAHLSVCAECREVVILSLPQAPTAVRQGSVAIPGSFWKRLWTPGLRWAGAMAVVAVAVTLVVELPRRQQSMRSELTQPQAKQPQGAPSESARDEQEPKPSLAAEPAIISKLEQTPADKMANASASVSRSAAAGVRIVTQPVKEQPGAAASVAKREILGRQSAEESKSAVMMAGAAKQDYVANYLFAANDASGTSSKYDDLPQAPSPQLTSQPGLAEGPPAQLSVFGGISGIPDARTSKKSKFRILNPLAPVERLGCIFCKVADVGLAKTSPSSPAITSSAVSSSAMDLHGKIGSALLKDQTLIASAPEKSSARGELEQSEAFTRRAPAAPPSTRLREGAAAQWHWKVEDGKLFKSLDPDQWQDAYQRANANFEFSFVTSHGADVWAGGSHATLLHSRDGGTIWEPVRLGDSASGRIVGIVVSGLNVQVQTSTNQAWSSSDAGKTWILQHGN